MYEVAHVKCLLVTTALQPCLEHRFGRLTGASDLTRLLDGIRKGSFAIDVLPRGDRVQHDLLVLVSWSCDEDRLDALVPQRLPVIRDKRSFRDDRRGLLHDDGRLEGVTYRGYVSDRPDLSQRREDLSSSRA